jgi:hypothetical protein
MQLILHDLGRILQKTLRKMFADEFCHLEHVN